MTNPNASGYFAVDIRGNLSHHSLTESLEEPGITTENRRLKLRSYGDSQAFDTLMNGYYLS